MPREQLLGLAADTDRLVNAGATAACGNENLLRRGRTLRELGKKVAALNPVADAVDKATQATPAEMGRYFLDLLAITRQVRASLAGTGIPGDLRFPDPSGPWRTPLSVRDLSLLHQALTRSSSSREQTIKKAFEDGIFDDLRLFPPLLTALSDGNRSVWLHVSFMMLPSFGMAASRELVAALEFPGKAIDARRLHAIAQIDKAAAANACHRALQKGGPALRAAALEMLPTLWPAQEVERAALPLVKDKNAEVGMQALNALRVGKSEETLETLIRVALASKQDTKFPAAWWSLQKIANADTTSRLLRELPRLIADISPTRPKEQKGGRAPGEKDKAQAELVRKDRIAKASQLMQVMAARKDGDRRAVTLTLVAQTNNDDLDLSAGALEALGNIDPVTEEVLPPLLAALGHKYQSVVLAALAGLQKMAPADCDPSFSAVRNIIRKTTDSEVYRAAVWLLVKLFPLHPAEVEQLIREMLRSKDPAKQQPFYSAAAKIGPAIRSLLPDMFQVLRDGNRCCVEALSHVDPEGSATIPAMIDLLRDRKTTVHDAVLQVLTQYGTSAKAAIPTLIEMQERHKKDTLLLHWIDTALRAIDR